MQSIVDAMSNVAVSVKDKVAGAAASVKSSGPSNSVGKIHTYPDNYRVIRAQTVAAMNGFSVDVAEVTMGTTNKTPEFLAKFPAGKVPAFEGADGCCIEQTSAIAHYLAQMNPTTDLLGHSTQEAAQVQSWVAFADEDLSTKVAMLKGMIKGYIPYSAPIENYLFNTIMEKHLPHLNQYLETNTFLVGERISLADLTMTSVLAEAFTVILGENERTGFNHVMRYYNTMVNQPTIMSFYESKKTLLPERQKASPPKKEAKPKAAPAAAAAKPKAQPKAKAQDEEEEEDLVPKEAAVKSPLDLLPPSAFKLDDLKRHYSNNETRGPNGTIEWFYKNCDFEGYSVWKVDYKYPEDLSLIFMSNNLLGGFFNRLEASRKYLFGNFAVCGIDNNNNIHGVFVCRGQDIMIPIKAAPDWESYEFTKLDLSVYEDKKYFEDAMADELSVKGRAYADGKTFK